MSKKHIRLAHGLDLGLESVTETFGILAMKGRGKTYTGTKLFEEMYNAGAQVVAMDPVGNWRFLRVDKDGKSAGLPVPVFGGPHGDLPLEPSSGAFVAKTIVERELSVILDVSRFRKGQRKKFAADFAEELFELKKDHPTPMHLFIEEARMFVPQKMQPEDARMLGAFEDIVRLGRNYGIGASLIDQRPQSVNKDVLSQVSVLIALGLSGKLERKEIEEWVRSKEVAGAEALSELAGLQPGEAFVWSPAFLKTFQRIKIAPKGTFDGSATPRLGQKTARVDTKPLGEADLEKLKVAMKEMVEQAEAKDPAHLKASLTKMKTQVLKLEAELQRAKDVPATKPAKRVEVSVLKEAHVARLEKVAVKAADALAKVTNGPIADVQKLLGEVRSILLRPIVSEPIPNTPSQVVVYKTSEAVPRGRRDPVETDRQPKNGLRKGARNMLAALGMLHPREMTRGQVAMIACLAPTSGTFSAYLSDLRAGGYIVENGSDLSLSNLGIEYLGPGWHPTPPTTDGLVALWGGKLRAGARTMLQKLVESYPHGFSRQALAEAAGLVASSGTFSAYLSDLRRAGLLNEEGPGN